MARKQTIRLITVSLAVAIASSSYAQSTIKISAVQSSLTAHISPLVTQIYRNINQPISISYAPSRRSLTLVNQGIMDAELYRFSGINKRYPNLRRVPVALHHITLTAYAKSDDIQINGWDSLARYHIGIIRGIELVNRQTTSMQRTIADNQTQLFNMLENDRIQIALSARFAAQPILSQLKNSHIKALDPPVVSIPVYHFVHKKYQHLIPALSDNLKSLLSIDTANP